MDLTITIPTPHQDRVLEACVESAGHEFALQPANGCELRFSWEEKNAGETYAEYGRRVTAVLLRTLVRCYEYNRDLRRYQTEIAAVAQPSESVPEEIVE